MTEEKTETTIIVDAIPPTDGGAAPADPASTDTPTPPSAEWTPPSAEAESASGDLAPLETTGTTEPASTDAPAGSAIEPTATEGDATGLADSADPSVSETPAPSEGAAPESIPEAATVEPSSEVSLPLGSGTAEDAAAQLGVSSDVTPSELPEPPVEIPALPPPLAAITPSETAVKADEPIDPLVAEVNDLLRSEWHPHEERAWSRGEHSEASQAKLLHLFREAGWRVLDRAHGLSFERPE